MRDKWKKLITKLPKLPPAGRCWKPPTQQFVSPSSFQAKKFKDEKLWKLTNNEKGFPRVKRVLPFIISSKARKRFSLSKIEFAILLRCCEHCHSCPRFYSISLHWKIHETFNVQCSCSRFDFFFFFLLSWDTLLLQHRCLLNIFVE